MTNQIKRTKNKPPVNDTNEGFTLIEIMVVVLIMGLMVALLTINLSRDLDRLARLEADRFLAIVDEVRDEAIIAGETYLLTVNEANSSYQFSAARQGNTQVLADDLFKPRSLQKGLEMDWKVFEDFNGERTANVLITPLGEITPFDARFVGDETEFHVLVNDENELERRDAENK